MTISQFLFKNRSYTPLPFLVLMVIFAKPYLLTVILGLAIAILGESIRFWGVSYIGSESRTTDSVGGTKLMISGPYALTRNPLYIGNLLIYTGTGIISNALFPYLICIAILFFILQYYFIIKDEEKYLLEKFGESFKNYCKNVNRFIPKFKIYKMNDSEKYAFNFKRGLKSEKRTLQGFSLTILILIVIWIYQIYG